LDGIFTTPAFCHSGLGLLWLLPCLDLPPWLGSSRLISMLLLTPASPRTCCICALLLLR
jgi:hypothetical protein